MDEKRRIELELIAFDALRRLKETQAAERYNINSESLSLKQTVLQKQHAVGVRQYGSSVFSMASAQKTLENRARRHNCSRNCSFSSYRKDTKFTNCGTTYNATGNVFVCNSTSLVHICGPDNCSKQIQAPRGEGSMCGLTGIHLCVEFSSTTNDEIHEVRFSVGRAAASPYTASSSTSSSVYSSEKSTDTSTVYDKIASACGNINDARHVFESAESHDDIETLKQKAIQRSKNREIASRIYKMHIMGQVYTDALIKKHEIANKEYIEVLAPAYYKSCARNNTKANLITLALMYHEKVAPTLSGIYINGNVGKMNEERMPYYNECILLLWESMENLPVVSQYNITFEKCCVAFLNHLSTGLVTTIYEAPDGSPHRPTTLTPLQQQEYKKHRITLIPQHTKLILADMTEVRNVHSVNSRTPAPTTLPSTAAAHPKTKKEGVGKIDPGSEPKKETSAKGKRKRHLAVSPAMIEGGRRGSGYRKKTKINRRKRVVSQPISSISTVNKLYDAAITSCSTLEEFIDCFCLDSLIEIQL